MTVLQFPPRSSAAVFVLPADGGWLVLAREHGWLHGDRDEAARNAHWLSSNLALPIREVPHERP
jgi:hypothetical protein